MHCTIIHHTGTMIRFTPAQLGALPNADQDIQVLLPDGSIVRGHFRRNMQNPNISGRGIVAYIKRMLPFGATKAMWIMPSATGTWVLSDSAKQAA